MRDISVIREELGYRDIVPVEEGIRRTVHWYVENRPEPGGELELQLGDPFDYEAEDRIIREYREAEERLLEISFAG